MRNTSVVVRAACVDDYFSISFRQEDLIAISRLDDPVAHYKVCLSGGPSYTIESEGIVVATGGAFFVNSWTAELWMLTGWGVNGAAVSLVRTGRRLREEAHGLGARRAFSTVQAGFQKAERYMRAIGFEREGLLRRFGRFGEDFILFSSVR